MTSKGLSSDFQFKIFRIFLKWKKKPNFMHWGIDVIILP